MILKNPPLQTETPNFSRNLRPAPKLDVDRVGDNSKNNYIFLAVTVKKFIYRVESSQPFERKLS